MFARAAVLMAATASPGMAAAHPLPTPKAVSTGYSNTHLPPAGWNPLVTLGPTSAPDASRISWPAVCAARHPAISCRNGEPSPHENSAAIIAETFMRGTGGVMGWCSTSGYTATFGGSPGSQTCQGHDTMSGLFFATSSDPAYKIHCAVYACGSGTKGDGSDNLEGQSVHIADGSIPNLGGDGHLSIINERANLICEFWQAGPSPHSALRRGGSLTVGQGSCGTLSSAWDGVSGIFNAYSSNLETTRFLVRPEELLSGHIPHALYASVSNNASGHVHAWPATFSDGACGTASNLGVEGMVYYLSTAGYRRLMASKAHLLKKTMLRVYHEYGVFDLDSSGCNRPPDNYTNFLGWDPQLWTQHGRRNPWETIRTALAAGGNPRDISHDGDYWRMNLDLSDTGLTAADFSVLPFNDARCVVTGVSCSPDRQSFDR